MQQMHKAIQTQESCDWAQILIAIYCRKEKLPNRVCAALLLQLAPSPPSIYSSKGIWNISINHYELLLSLYIMILLVRIFIHSNLGLSSRCSSSPFGKMAGIRRPFLHHSQQQRKKCFGTIVRLLVLAMGAGYFFFMSSYGNPKVQEPKGQSALNVQEVAVAAPKKVYTSSPSSYVRGFQIKLLAYVISFPWLVPNRKEASLKDSRSFACSTLCMPVYQLLC